MNWTERAVKEARKRIAEELELLKTTYSPEFAEYCKKTGLFFSFGDIVHLISFGLGRSIWIRHNGGAAGIAYFEELIRRFRLYLIQELKAVLNSEGPYKTIDVHRPIDYNFVVDFLEQFKRLDELTEQLKEIRTREGGYYQ